MKTSFLRLVLLLFLLGILHAAPCHYELYFDINFDCRIDIADLSEFAAMWLLDCNDDPGNSQCIPLDMDIDGFDISIDCDDNDPNTHPGAAELCDGKDNDCDGQIDEACNLKEDGQPCILGGECLSDYCQNGYCCESGDCCSLAADCPSGYSSSSICINPSACQGSREDAVCADSMCGSAAVEDDSGCGVTTLADSCGPYADVYCTGQVEQTPPTCLTQCIMSSDCDPVAYCTAATCVDRVPDGLPCIESDQCLSGYCQNGYCCGSGDCCSLAADCPSGYSSPSICTNPSACQGSREDAVCADSMCGSTAVDDDSDCGVTTLADSCGPYANVYCTGQIEQTSPTCQTYCVDNTDCDPVAYCTTSICVYRMPNGSPCVESDQCISGFCVDGFCCNSSCSGPCRACAAALSGGVNGTCAFIPSGLDPQNECSGNCDGAGSCLP